MNKVAALQLAAGCEVGHTHGKSLHDRVFPNGTPLAYHTGDNEVMMHSRVRGFTLIELVVVIVIVGILTVIAMPKIGRSARSNAVHAASRKTVAYLARARALAVQNGQPARFYVNGNTIIVGRVNPDASVTPIGQQDLGQELKVTITTVPAPTAGSLDSITFNPRGMAQYVGAKYRRFEISRGGMVDTVCIFGVGKVAVNKCQLAQSQ